VAVAAGLAGARAAHTLMLLRRGYALFYPNPRGSAGRGREFVRHVLGDMGGADTTIISPASIIWSKQASPIPSAWESRAAAMAAS